MSERQPHERGDRPEPDRSLEQTEATPPRIWIGSLADYNAGHLHGEWCDAAVDDDELLAAAERVVTGSLTADAEEWAIFDHEGFQGFPIGESEDLRIVAAVARGILEHGPAFAAWAELHDADPNMLASFSDAYLGDYPTAGAWAEQRCADLEVEDTIERALPEHIARYVRVDYDALANDAWLGGDIYLAHHAGGVWIFDARL